MTNVQVLAILYLNLDRAERPVLRSIRWRVRKNVLGSQIFIYLCEGFIKIFLAAREVSASSRFRRNLLEAALIDPEPRVSNPDRVHDDFIAPGALDRVLHLDAA